MAKKYSKQHSIGRKLLSGGIAFFQGIKYYILGIYNNAGKHHIFLFSGGMAFMLFIALIPITLIMFMILGFIIAEPTVQAEISAFIERVIPYPDLATNVKSFVFERVDEFEGYKSIFGAIGIVGLFFAATGLFGAMRTILNKVYEVEQDEAILKGKARDFRLVMLVLVFFLGMSIIMTALEFLLDLARDIGFLQVLEIGIVDQIAIHALEFGISVGSFFIIYFFIPFIRPPKKVILVSAVAAAVLWGIAQNLFSYYMTNIVNFERIYGAYSVVPAIVFWIYYTSIVFMLGAEIGQLYRKRRLQKSDD